KRVANTNWLLFGLIGGGAALVAVGVVVLILVLNKGGSGKSDSPANRRPEVGPPGGLEGVGKGGPGAPFLDQRKTMPAKLEWNREIVSRFGGPMKFRITSQGPFSVILVTSRVHKAMLANTITPDMKKECLVDVDAKGSELERTVTLLPGSYVFIIENQAN